MRRLMQVLKESMWWVAVFAVLVLGMLVLGFPDTQVRSVYPPGEMQRDVAVLEQMHRGVWPELGPPASLGTMHFGPVYYYILFLTSLVTGWSVYGLVLANWLWLLLTGALCSWFVWEVRHTRAAVVGATLVFGLSVLTFQLTRYVSNPNFVPACAAVFFICLFRIYSGRGTAWVWLGTAASLAVAGQLHFAALGVLGLCFAAAIVRFRPPLRIVLLMVCVALFLWLPFLQYEFTHQFSNMQSLARVGGEIDSGFAGWALLIAQYVGFLVSPVISVHVFFDISYTLGMSFVRILALALLGGVFAVWLDRRRAMEKEYQVQCSPAFFFKDMWIAGSLLFLIPFGFSAGTRIYYYFALMPLQYVVIGWLCEYGVLRKQWVTLAYGGCVFLVLALLQRLVYFASL